MQKSLSGGKEANASCLVVTSNATLGIGGEGIFALELAAELENKKISSTFLMRNELKGAELMSDYKSARKRLPHVRNSALLVFNHLSFSILSIPLALKYIKNGRKNNKNILIHVHDGTFSGLVGVIASKLSNAPLVLTFHGTHILSAYYIFGRTKYLARTVAKGLTCFCTNNADRLITVDEKTKRLIQYETQTPKKIEIIPTFCRKLTIDNEQGLGNNLLNLPQNSFLIGYIGRLSPEKNVLSLVTVFAELSKTTPDAYLVIAGDGSTKKEIEKYVNNQNLEKKVLLLGYVLDVASVLSKLDCIVLPSKSEGFPIVIFEAWSMGVPVIASNVIPTLENEVNAFTYPPADTDMLKTILSRIFSNRKIVNDMVENGKNQQSLSPRMDVVDRYLSIYLDVSRHNAVEKPASFHLSLEPIVEITANT
jgi:glycosyltransferase involved in cell wall biosynthesis